MLYIANDTNLLKANVQALVNTVNCVGVMGKGIALQFKQAFPENFKAYQKACKAHQVHPGHMQVFKTNYLHNPQFIINFPTKTHWKAKSRIEHIAKGLADLVTVIQQENIQTIAIPPLGCGHGGLQWAEVKPLIEQAFNEIPHVEVYLYEPKGTPAAETMINRTPKPKMSMGRALLIKLIENYRVVDERLTALEIQKLAYFLQELGDKNLKLSFEKGRYGPYADNLHHALQDMEGHYIRGLGDNGRKKDTEITLLADAVDDADQYLNENETSNATERLEKLKQLVYGFDDPYGMELLASAHWVIHHEDAQSLDDTIFKIHHWGAKGGERKRKLMNAAHIKSAFNRLAQMNLA